MEGIALIDKIETKKGTVEFPCMHPKIVPIEQVVANDYNPNHVSDSNMELLLQSVLDNGFCFPVVTIYDDILEKYVVIDGFHRYLLFRDYLEADCIPIVYGQLPRYLSPKGTHILWTSVFSLISDNSQ